MPENRIIKILLADDHVIVRQGLRALLASEKDLEIVGEAGNGLEALEAARRLKPDIAILDLMMPELNGLETTRQMFKNSPQTRVIILSMYDDEGFVLDALAKGAAGYVLKDSDAVDLIHAVREVSHGRKYLSPPLSDRAIAAYQRLAKSNTVEKHDTLTNREREVLQLTAEGFSNGEIAQKLGISTRTAETHRQHVLRKLGLRSQADVVRYAIRKNLIAAQNAEDLLRDVTE